MHALRGCSVREREREGELTHTEISAGSRYVVALCKNICLKTLTKTLSGRNTLVIFSCLAQINVTITFSLKMECLGFLFSF